MSTTANRTRGAVPTRMAAAIAALSLLAMPVPAGAQGSGRTVLLTLTEGASLSQLADTVGALGGRVLATLELSDSLLVELPTGVGAPAGSAEIPDTPMKVNGTQQYYDDDEPTYRETIGAADGSSARHGRDGRPGGHRRGGRRRISSHVEHINVAGVGRRWRRPRPRHLPRRHHRRDAATLPGCGTRRDLLDVQVADEEGNTSLSQGARRAWRRSQTARDVDVVNISLSTGSPLPPSFDPLARALERLWADGRDRRGRRRQRRPGCRHRRLPRQRPDPAHRRRAGRGRPRRDASDDAVAEFSSRGTQYCRREARPGGAGRVLDLHGGTGQHRVQREPGLSHDGDGYMRGSGTSMSAAVVSGAAAAVLAANSEPDARRRQGAPHGTTYAPTTLMPRMVRVRERWTLARRSWQRQRSPSDPTQALPAVGVGEWGPADEDAEAWAAFAAAWEAGRWDAVRPPGPC